MSKLPFAPTPVRILHKYLNNELGYEYGIIIDRDTELKYQYFVKLFRDKPMPQDYDNVIIRHCSGLAQDEEWLDPSEFEVLID